MRYVEARLERISDELLQDIDKETVDFMDNFDGSLKEPTVLPAKVPTLLVNGSSGIAVGMATNIPPHNLAEVAKAVIAYSENPEIEIFDLAKIMPGPDFPTGGIVQGTTGIMQYFNGGRGRESNSSLETEPLPSLSQRAKIWSTLGPCPPPLEKPAKNAATSSFESLPSLSLSRPSNVGGVKP